MTSPPDWAVSIPSAPVHPNARSELVRPFTAQQLQQMGREFVEQFLRQVVLALAGHFMPGPHGAAFDQLAAWGSQTISDISAAVTTAYQQVMDFLTGVVNSTEPDWDDWLLGLLTGESSLDAAKLINIFNIPAIPDANVPGVMQIVNNIVNEWLGLAGVWTQADSAAALADSAATIAALSSAIADLQALYGQAQTNASLFVVDFSTFPDTANLPGIFSETYSGSGTGTYGVKDGRARVYPVNDAPRSASGIYTAGTALTDYQIAGGVWTSAPADDGFGNRGYHILQCRANTTGTTKVYARFARYSLQLRNVVSGAETVMATVGNDTAFGAFRFKTNTLYYLLAGTPGGVRTFEVREGSPTGGLVLAHTETGTTSQYGPAYLSGGVGAQWYASIFGTVEPGALLYWLFGDNTAPSSLGSTFRARKTSGTVDSSAGDHPIPDSYTVERITNDMAWNPTGNAVTVSIDGTYMVSVFQELSAGLITTNIFRALVARNGTVAARGPAFVYPTGAATTVGFGVTVPVYCAAGDVIQPGYWSSGATTGALTAESTGTATYFAVALSNRSLS